MWHRNVLLTYPPLQMREARFEKLDTIEECRDRLSHRVGHEVMVEIDAAGAFPAIRFRMNDFGRYASDGHLGWRILDDDRIGTDSRATPDRDRSKDLRTRSNDDTILERRMPLAGRPGRAAERDAVIERDILANHRRLTDHNPGAMVDEKPPADFCARMYVDIGEKPAKPR